MIDNGSTFCRAGFAGYDSPHAVFTSVVGRFKYPGIVFGMDKEDAVVVGDDALEKNGILNLKYPVECGIITNWEDMEKLWHHTFYSVLRIEPEEHPLFLTEVQVGSKAIRERMTQIMFEVFKIAGLFVSKQAVLSLYSSGRTTGMVLQIGDSFTYAVPVYDGYALPQAIFRLDLGGRDITIYLKKLLAERGHSVIKESILKKIKEKHCFVALDFEIENKRVEESANPGNAYELIDGNRVVLLHERHSCTEALFKPNLIGKNGFGIDELILRAAMRCTVDIRPELYDKIVLSGGSSLFPGLIERLKIEVGLKNEAKFKVGVYLSGEHSVWVGASIFASLSTFKDMWITIEEYDEGGPAIVHRKCL